LSKSLDKALPSLKIFHSFINLHILYSAVKKIFQEIINNARPNPTGGPPIAGPPAAMSGSGHHTTEVSIPGQRAGLIIGKSGETIKQLQEQRLAQRWFLFKIRMPPQSKTSLYKLRETQQVWRKQNKWSSIYLMPGVSIQEV
jgi:hypothetical protein